jgi:L-amino acid N-acyltransferase YncA
MLCIDMLSIINVFKIIIRLYHKQVADFHIHTFLGVKDVNEDNRLKGLLPSLLTCASDAFGDRLTAEDIRQHKLHMVGDQFLVAVNDKGAVFGYCAVSIVSPQKQFETKHFSNEPGAYVASIAIHHAAQGKGLSRELVRKNVIFGLDQGVRSIFLRTQNPRVGESIKHTLHDFVRSGWITNLSETYTLQKSAYHGMLTAEKPLARTIDYPELDYDNGDAYFIYYRFGISA